MCNLYTLRKRTAKELMSAFDLKECDAPDLFTGPQHWPMRTAPVVRRCTDSRPGREAAAMRWSLVPFWADDPKIGRNMTNARAETVVTKPAFRAAYKSRRCLIPATGFCEWKAKVWYEFTIPDRPLFAMAGLWESWNKGDEPLTTFTMLTTEANNMVAEYHTKQRMPVILEEADYDLWLTGIPDKVAPLVANRDGRPSQPFPSW